MSSPASAARSSSESSDASFHTSVNVRLMARFYSRRTAAARPRPLAAWASRGLLQQLKCATPRLVASIRLAVFFDAVAATLSLIETNPEIGTPISNDGKPEWLCTSL